jgi:hypothetical protein
MPFLGLVPMLVTIFAGLVFELDNWVYQAMTFATVCLAMVSTLHRTFRDWRLSKFELAVCVEGCELGLGGLVGLLFGGDTVLWWGFALVAGAVVFLWATGRSLKRDIREFEAFGVRVRQFMDEQGIPGPLGPPPRSWRQEWRRRLPPRRR